MLRRAVPLLSLLLVSLLFVSCDGEARHLKRAQGYHARGLYVEALEELSDTTAPEAQDLRRAVEAALAQREEALAEVARILELAPEAPQSQVEGLLFAGPGRIEDREVAEAVASARSALADEYAAARARGMRWPTQAPPGSSERPEAASDQVLAAKLQPFGASTPGEATGTLARAPKHRPQEKAPGSVDTKGAGARAATGGAGVIQRAVRTRPWREELNGLDEPRELWEWVQEREEAGELGAALAGLGRIRESVAVRPQGEGGGAPLDGEHLAREDMRLGARLALRKELSRSVNSSRPDFASLGVVGVEAGGVRFDGSVNTVLWPELGAEDWRALTSRADLSVDARLGLAMEYLERSEEDLADAVLQRLLRLHPDRAPEVFQVIAWHRGETVPSAGYVYRADRWVAASEFGLQTGAQVGAQVGAGATGVTTDDDEQARRLANRLGRAKAGDGEQLFRALLAMGRDDLCREALEQRWGSAVRAYGSSGARRDFKRLLEDRREVDRLRSAILTRIEDPEAYPEDLSSPGASRRKEESQRFIDARVAELRALFSAARPVHLRPAMRGLVEEVQWLLASERTLRLERSLRPEELPGWLGVVDPKERRLTLERFCWTAEESEGQARDRAVMRRNQDLMENNPPLPPETATSPAEVRQVRITNRYRMLLGRRALAWDARIQAAAWDHSTYMSTTGDFGHIESIEGRETTTKRLARHDYGLPGGENCTVDIGGPDAAHQSWLHSPGHHRNLVSARHTQMASSTVGRYWTQVFGMDTAFLKELEAWSD